MNTFFAVINLITFCECKIIISKVKKFYFFICKTGTNCKLGATYKHEMKKRVNESADKQIRNLKK